jgi:hypothetical protein
MSLTLHGDSLPDMCRDDSLPNRKLLTTAFMVDNAAATRSRF